MRGTVQAKDSSGLVGLAKQAVKALEQYAAAESDQFVVDFCELLVGADKKLQAASQWVAYRDGELVQK